MFRVLDDIQKKVKSQQKPNADENSKRKVPNQIPNQKLKHITRICNYVYIPDLVHHFHM